MRPLLALLIVTVGVAPALHSQDTKSEKIYQHDIQSYQLRHAKADAIVEILNEQFPSLIKFSGNSLTNTVYARIPKENQENHRVDRKRARQRRITCPKVS